MQVTLPGEGKDRVFRVAIKWVAQVSLFALEEALEGRTRQIPFDAILVSIIFKFNLTTQNCKLLLEYFRNKLEFLYLLLYFNFQIR